MRIVDILLPLTGSGLLLALLIIMIRRRMHRQYPFFSGYLAFTLLTAVVLFSVSGSDQIYFYAYWISDAFNAVLALLALNEIFYDVFHGFYSFWWFRLIFPGVVVLMSFVAVREALLKPYPRAPVSMWVILSIESALSLIQIGIVVALLVLALGLRVHWRRYPFYLALGFAVSGAGDWIVHAMLLKFGNKHVLVTRYAPPTIYICATLIWLWCFSGKFVSEPGLEFGSAGDHVDADPTPKLRMS